ncbi:MULTISPECIES: cupin domain-containing protein [unclassified Mesorhizobium]|uniref:(R)-mandelonitrile lyase n=1 Tax=unclassified Mesorhizobium TaxID=325217 RepID=UPI001129A268|nr:MULTISPECIES: cupin domain-containing protein [unclassified Mesorhizobium]MBZ9702232.1 cupin domain-containing protein [Mesorhizobium sp. CO1-1-3]MBZ9947318.1 cupin domain-containing protein [Mesorhizobium sp. BR1-1-11]MCA0058351.1 cupin domain-containing protein [Mesorhizobium sp. B261B1A]TPJ06464.1 cupin domain-containing protein [Mesorhizobium sp. B2-8-1]TPK55162.1 cupin domain-containing protein [Mesorhizobium sp. B2-5-2]
MKKILTATAASVAGTMPVQAQGIEIRTNGSTPAVIGAAENFTGQAVITALFPATEITRASTGLVNFAPGARTVWHTHPAGQLLIVRSGQGWIREDGKEALVINPGDVVWIPAGVKHWHGATATSPMAHIALSYMHDGKNVDWLEPVSDEQYR